MIIPPSEAVFVSVPLFPFLFRFRLGSSPLLSLLRLPCCGTRTCLLSWRARCPWPTHRRPLRSHVDRLLDPSPVCSPTSLRACRLPYPIFLFRPLSLFFFDNNTCVPLSPNVHPHHHHQLPRHVKGTRFFLLLSLVKPLDSRLHR